MFFIFEISFIKKRLIISPKKRPNSVIVHLLSCHYLFLLIFLDLYYIYVIKPQKSGF